VVLLAEVQVSRLRNIVVCNQESYTDFFSFKVDVFEIDELGVSFYSNSFMRKGVEIELNLGSFLNSSEGCNKKLRVIKVEHDPSIGKYKLYGEFVVLELSELALIMRQA
jgi:hypothetical protein